MNEDEYRNTYHQINHQRCVFEKMVLLRYGNCEFNQKLLLAEREAMACQSATAQKNCQLLLNTIRQNARFALQITKADSPLPHAKEIKVQAGGLFGLQQYLEHKNTALTEALSDEKLKFDNDSSQPIKNIHKTVSDALDKFIEIKYFPYNEIVKAIIHFTLPSRKRKKIVAPK
ncbi:MAG: hypothetical protein QM504_01385 [Pseudomonadota bacterium]